MRMILPIVLNVFIIGLFLYSKLLPYKDKTKAQIVAEYIKEKHSIENLINTRSCYSSDDKECGVCRSCVRKFVAFAVNGIDTSRHFAFNPMTSIDAALRGRCRCFAHRQNTDFDTPRLAI